MPKKLPYGRGLVPCGIAGYKFHNLFWAFQGLYLKARVKSSMSQPHRHYWKWENPEWCNYRNREM